MVRLPESFGPLGMPPGGCFLFPLSAHPFPPTLSHGAARLHQSIVCGLPPGRTLLAEVRSFYGPSFRVNLHDDPDGTSRYAIETGGPSLKFGGAIIDLNTKTDRVKAAAMHD